MKNKSYIGLFILVLVGVISLPFVLGGEVCDYIASDTQLIVGNSIPSSIPFKNEVFNMYSGQDTVEGTIVIDNSTITKYECGVLTENNTYDVFVKDKKTVEDIQNAENKLDAFNSALGDSINVKGVTAAKKVKLFFASIAITIASWFS